MVRLATPADLDFICALQANPACCAQIASDPGAVLRDSSIGPGHAPIWDPDSDPAVLALLDVQDDPPRVRSGVLRDSVVRRGSH